MQKAPTEHLAARADMSLRGAVALGIGCMVGAGIFALPGQAALVVGRATWLACAMGGLVAPLPHPLSRAPAGSKGGADRMRARCGWPSTITSTASPGAISRAT